MIGLSLVASIGRFVSHLFLVDVCSAFCSSDLIVGRFAEGQHVARVCTCAGVHLVVMMWLLLTRRT